MDAFERALESDAGADRVLLASPSPLTPGARLRLHIHIDASGAEIAVPGVAVANARVACPRMVAELVRRLDAIHRAAADPVPSPAGVWRFFHRFRPGRGGAPGSGSPDPERGDDAADSSR